MKNRCPIRKKRHNYAAPGHYFTTVCVRNHSSLLGTIGDEEIVLSEMGLIVREEWQALPKRFPNIRLDAFAIMPNHIHGIITIAETPRVDSRLYNQPNEKGGGNFQTSGFSSTTVRTGASPAPTLGTIIGAFKSLSDRRCRQITIASYSGQRFGHLWQRNYYDHIIANEDELDRIRTYIRNNIRRWNTDADYIP